MRLAPRAVLDGVLHELVRDQRHARDGLLILEHLSIEVRHEAPDDGDEADVWGEPELEEVGIPLLLTPELEARISPLRRRVIRQRRHSSPLLTPSLHVLHGHPRGEPWVLCGPFTALAIYHRY